MPNFDGIPILYKVKDLTRRLMCHVPLVPHREVLQESTSVDIFWTVLKIKEGWRKMHAVLSWVNLDYFLHVHMESRYFMELPNINTLVYTVNDSKFEKQKLEGSIQLYINGLRQFIDQDYEETTTGIRLIGDTRVKSGDFMWCHYRKIAVGEEELNV